MMDAKAISANSRMKYLVWHIVLIAGLVSLTAPSAKAHEPEYRMVRHSEGYAYVQRHQAVPYWLKRDAGFHRWYWQSSYIHRPVLSWDRLYKLYLADHHYHRAHGRRNDAHHHDRHFDRNHKYQSSRGDQRQQHPSAYRFERRPDYGKK